MKQDTTDNMAEQSYNMCVEYILKVSISDDAFGTDIERSLNADIIPGAKVKRDISIFQVLAASNFCKKTINSIYPEAQNPGVNRRVQNQTFSLDG